MVGLAWGGQANGKIPASRLVAAVNFAPLSSQQKYLTSQSGLLRDDVARQWSLMTRDCKAATGQALYLSEGYRSFDSQKKRWDDPKHTAAKAYPGTSLHGWALSTDYNDGDPVVVRWVLANCGKYGFVRTIKSEQWHLDFIKVPSITPASGGAQIPIDVSEEDEMSAAGEQKIIDLLTVVADKLNVITNNVTDPKVGLTATGARSADAAVKGAEKLDALERHTLAVTNAVTDPETGLQAVLVQVASSVRK